MASVGTESTGGNYGILIEPEKFLTDLFDIDVTLTGTNTPGQRESRSNGNECLLNTHWSHIDKCSLMQFSINSFF